MTEERQLQADLELPPSQTLKAGAINCLYESGNLRYIYAGNTELLRKIYGAVRNQHWDTIPFIIRDEKITVHENSFKISYTAIYGDEQPIYKSDFIIEGRPGNSISFSMKGTAIANFYRNRIGLCALQPIQKNAGKSMEVSRPDGSVYYPVLPELISPTLPVVAIRQLKWSPEKDVVVSVIFEGDTFEMEDQRNWADSSYKIYSTPSAMPSPVEVKKGDTIEQRITLELTLRAMEATTGTLQTVVEEKLAFPQIGYCRSVNTPVLNDAILNYLLKIPFDHYRVTITMDHKEWRPVLDTALLEALTINTKLELVVYFSEDAAAELSLLTYHLIEKQLLVRTLLVLQKGEAVTPVTLLQYVYPILKKQLPAVKVGYGTDLLFVDLNDKRPGGLPFDFLSFGIQPQVHSFDNRSILENLQNQEDAIKTAEDFANGQLICVSPIALKNRFDGKGIDKRIHSFFAALWTLISLQNFSAAYSITLYDLLGEAGIIQLDPAKPSPLYEALAVIQAFQPVWVVKQKVGGETLMNGLMLENEEGNRLFFKAPDAYVKGVKHGNVY